MKYEEEEIKDQTTVLVILNTIIAIILGIIFLIIWCVDHVYAQPQYRVSQGSWGEWTNVNVDTEYTFATNLNTSWSSYIQIKDTVAFDNNKTYYLTANLEVQLQESGTKDMNSALDPYIYNGSTLTNQTEFCTITGTRSDKTSSSPLVVTTHTYKVNVNCVGLKGQSYYPYLTLRFLTNGSSVPTAFKFNIKSWEYHVGSDSTDANNIMNNQNQNTQSIINGLNDMGDSITNSVNQSTSEVIDAIQNQYNVCSYHNIMYNKDNNTEYGLLNISNGNLNINNNFITTTDYIKVTNGKQITMTINNSPFGKNYVFYNQNKQFVAGYTTEDNTITYTPTQDGYLRVSFHKEKQLIVTGEYCYNILEKETEQMDEFLNYDHNFGNQSDTSYANTTHQNEETMTANLDGNLTNVDINIDSDANGLIWYIIEHTVHANTVVFVMVVTILSLGIVKLVLGR